MTVTLSDKHLAFVSEYLRDCSPPAAALRAGYAARTGAKLLADPAVRAEIDRRQAEVAAKALVGLQTLLDEAERARAVAEAADNASAMVSATKLKAELVGLLRAEPGQAAEQAALDRQTADQRRHVRTAAELLAGAAMSLGLPSTATPSQIVGAVAQRSIAPPEVFELLRAQHVEDPA